MGKIRENEKELLKRLSKMVVRDDGFESDKGVVFCCAVAARDLNITDDVIAFIDKEHISDLQDVFDYVFANVDLDALESDEDED